MNLPQKVALVLFLVILFLAATENNMKTTKTKIVPVPANALRYIAIGDSYSAGTGTTPENSWPSLLADDLSKNGIRTILAANPSVAGYTTRDAIDWELPQLPEKAGLATLMLGVNDWVQSVPPEAFRNNFIFLLEDLSKKVPPDKLFVITIPDFSFAPIGGFFAGGRNISQGIEEFNQIIKEESEKRNVTVIDIVPASRLAPSEYADGLHPNAEGYKKWEEVIFAVVKSVLQSAATF